MLNVRLKTKFILFSILPLIIVTVAVLFTVRSEMLSNRDEQVNSIRQELMGAKKAELKNLVESAITAVATLTSDDSDAAREQARVMLRSIEYANDGYIFVYKYSGEAVAYRVNPAQEGKSSIGIKDPNGVHVIEELIKVSKAGGGYVNYSWMKPSVNAVMPKLSYAAPIESWGWMVGTGVYIDDIDAAVNAEAAKIDQRTSEILMEIGGIALVILLLDGVLAVFIANMIVGPLKSTADALNAISQGDGDLTQRLVVETRDEVGEVAEGFNGFAGNIQQVITEVKGAVGTLTESSASLNAIVEKTRQDAHHQKGETDQAAAAIHEMAAAVQQVAGSAAQAASAARDADQQASDGQAIVSRTIDSVTRLAEDVNRAAEVIARLGQDADQIGTIVSVIQGVAEQTNLLALNAAIEAARAGDQGRGFAVVADEVRTLATRTQQSTEEIHRMIERLQGGSREAVAVMEASQSQSQETMQDAASANDALDRITEAVGMITEMNTQIASAAEQQTAVADEISQNVQEIADIAERSSHNAGDISDMASSMGDIERRLSQLVGRFKV